MLLRRAVPDDEQAVAEVPVRSWHVAYRGLLPSDLLDRLDPPERPKRSSFATVGPARDTDAGGAGEMSATYVDPSRWGRGLGRALIGEARRLLAELRYRTSLP